jgi:nucleoside 2-deoxyribosyltransferase
MKTVYLAGPITGKTIAGANDWRYEVIRKLEAFYICGISPLRCEPARGNRYTLANADPQFGTARAIGSKNRMDVRMCDLTLAYMPKMLNDPWPSLGTISELAWAAMINKPTILVSDDPRITDHPVIDSNSGWILPTLDMAIEVIVGIFKDYP